MDEQSERDMINQLYYEEFVTYILMNMQVIENQRRESQEIEVPVTTKTRKYTNGVTGVLYDWLIAHKARPYPTEPEKRQLMAQTGLSLTQINNWMSNARRRTLKIEGNRKARRAQKEQKILKFNRPQLSSSNPF